MAKKRPNKLVPSSNKIVNINSKKEGSNIVLQADTGYYRLSYYKNRSEFQDIRTFSAFVKGAERIIRTSDEYKAFIHFLKSEIGLDHCAIMPGITDEKATVEMHHGPILTLFDYCAIVLDSMVARGENVSTFKVAKIVLQEHFDNNVQVVMLSKTAHQMVHTGKIFISPAQAWGDLNKFIERYYDGLTEEQVETINEYIEKAEQYKSTDNDVLGTSAVKDWNKASLLMPDLDEEEEEDEY